MRWRSIYAVKIDRAGDAEETALGHNIMCVLKALSNARV